VFAGFDQSRALRGGWGVPEEYVVDERVNTWDLPVSLPTTHWE
jgi:hypothetical protein